MPLIKAPLLAPSAAYAFIKDREADSQIITKVQPLLQWLRGCLKDTALSTKTLDFIDLKDRLMSRRQRLIRYLVPEDPPYSASHTTYVMQAPSLGMSPQVTRKKEVTPRDTWELQQLSLCRM